MAARSEARQYFSR